MPDCVRQALSLGVLVVFLSSIKLPSEEVCVPEMNSGLRVNAAMKGEL